MAAESAPKLELLYFGSPGRADAIRLAAAIGKVAMTDEPFNRERIKPDGGIGQVPVMYIGDDDGKKVLLKQSLAILLYVGELGGLAGSDALSRAEVISACEYSVDLSNAAVSSSRGLEGDEKLAARRKAAGEGEKWQQVLKHVDDHLKRTGTGFLVGDSLTVADLRVVSECDQAISGWYDGFPTEQTVYDAFPEIQSLRKRVHALPEWVAFYARPETEVWPALPAGAAKLGAYTFTG